MEIMSYILELIIALIIGSAVFWIEIQRKKQPKGTRIQETAKMVNKILLNNKWENIDDIIGILRKDSININYKLR